MRERLNATLNKTWQEWEIPREADARWPDAAKKMYADWWQARIARQREIDKSIAAKAEFEQFFLTIEFVAESPPLTPGRGNQQKQATLIKQFGRFVW